MEFARLYCVKQRLNKKHATYLSYIEFNIISQIFLHIGERNGKLPLRTCPGCIVPEPYRSPDWALVPAQISPIAEH
jgi:hypothetical protein